MKQASRTYILGEEHITTKNPVLMVIADGVANSPLWENNLTELKEIAKAAGVKHINQKKEALITEIVIKQLF